MGEPSAILAINSLDRYVGTKSTPVTSYFSAYWALSGLTQIALRQSPGALPPVYQLPQVNAILTDAGAPGIPIPNKILAVGNGFIQIERATTAAAPPGSRVEIEQVVQENISNQPVSKALEAQYNDSEPYSNNFSINSPGALIYGYINRIIVSQIQLSYNVPTVCMGKNDTFYIIGDGVGSLHVTIPHGFYYADELAATLQTEIRKNSNWQNVTVAFSPRDGFIFNSEDYDIYFPTYAEIVDVLGSAAPSSELIYKTYRLLGMTIQNSDVGPPGHTQISFDYPNFLYTPYIDIYSDVLTNYQNIKDTNSSIAKPKGLVARIYVSGTGQIQVTGSVSALGTAPFVMTSDLNTPKVIRWTPDVAVPSIDFQLLDQYGDFIPGPEQGYSTEFQMTLLCVEGRD
jgi:hypothetical protein